MTLPESPVANAFRLLQREAHALLRQQEDAIFPVQEDDPVHGVALELARAEREWERLKDEPSRYAFEHGHKPGVLVQLGREREINPELDVVKTTEAARVRLCRARAHAFRMIVDEAERRCNLWLEEADKPNGRRPL